MTPHEAIRYIESKGWSTTRLGLERTRALLHALGEPQKKLKFIHVAGSNGKGSACAMLDSILRAAGYRTGLYTSPYIEQFSERIRVDGENIPDARLAALAERVKAIADGMEDHPSQFELVTAIAMQHFYETQCDIVVLEVGMGGALDSTNAIDAPELALIMNIGLEHTEYLGRTLEEIALTKAGIIKSGCACVCYDGAPEVNAVIERVCAARGVPLFRADLSALEALHSDLSGQDFRWRGTPFRLRLTGEYQLRNVSAVLTGIEALRSRGWEIPEEAVRRGLAEAVWPARMELLGEAPLFLLDGGHNPQCIEALRESLEALLPEKKFVFLCGVLADKDYSSMLEQMLPLAQEFFCLTPQSERALPAEALVEVLRRCGAKATACGDISEGLAAALAAAGETGAVVAFGSLYLAGAVRGAYRAHRRAQLRKEGCAARRALSAEERAAASRRIVEALAGEEMFHRAGTVMLYAAQGAEVALDALAQHPLAKGKRFVYPLCTGEGEMCARAPRDASAWRSGYRGIREPIPERSDAVAPEEIDLVVCPCAAFDETGARLGMGGGFYDRFLPKCKNASICAVAFEAQKAERIPRERWDVPMDMIVTEHGAYRL